MASVRRSSVVGGRSAQRAGSGSGSDSIKIGQTAAVRLLPGYEVMQQLAAAQLAVRKPDRAEMLVVGAGTGAELTALAPGHPGWRFTPVDPAASMLAVARGKADAGGYADRVELQTGDVGRTAPAGSSDDLRGPCHRGRAGE